MRTQILSILFILILGALGVQALTDCVYIKSSDESGIKEVYAEVIAPSGQVTKYVMNDGGNNCDFKQGDLIYSTRVKFDESGYHIVIFNSIDNKGNSNSIEYPDKLMVILPSLTSITEINENTIIQKMVIDFYDYPNEENKTMINFYDNQLVDVPQLYINGDRCYSCVSKSGEIEYTYKFKLEKGDNEVTILTRRYSNQLWYSENKDFDLFGLNIDRFPFKYFNAVLRLNVGIPPLESLNIQGYKQRKIIVNSNIPYEFDLKFSGLKKLYNKETISQLNDTSSLICKKEETDFIQRFTKLDNQYTLVMTDYDEFSNINYYVEFRLKPLFRYQLFFYINVGLLIIFFMYGLCRAKLLQLPRISNFLKLSKLYKFRNNDEIIWGGLWAIYCSIMLGLKPLLELQTPQTQNLVSNTTLVAVSFIVFFVGYSLNQIIIFIKKTNR